MFPDTVLESVGDIRSVVNGSLNEFTRMVMALVTCCSGIGGEICKDGGV